MHGAFERGKSKFLLCQHGIPLLPSCARAYDHQQGEKEREKERERAPEREKRRREVDTERLS